MGGPNMKPSQKSWPCRQAGLTILEVVIMIVVLGVVGAITYPKFRLMLLQSRESYTKANLADIRGAVAIYYSDNYGLFPSDSGTPETRLSSIIVPAYLKEIPKVELVHHHSKKWDTINDRLDDKGDWIYTTLYGFVGVNCTHLDTMGKPISNW